MSETSYAKSGHNVGGIDSDRLMSIVGRIEKLEQEKKDVAENIKDVYTEAKSSGFDSKILRQVVRMRSMDHDKLEEMDHLIDLYRRALGV